MFVKRVLLACTVVCVVGALMYVSTISHRPRYAAAFRVGEVTLNAQSPAASLAAQIKVLLGQVEALNDQIIALLLPPPPAPIPPPILTLPANQTATTTGTGVAVFYNPPPTVSGGVPPVPILAVPTSGSIFPVGTTTVLVTARDALGQPAIPGSFTVTVTSTAPPPTPLPPVTGVILQTSFECPTWVQNKPSAGSDPDPACKVHRSGDWQVNSTTPETITLAANNPKGPGLGFRHWRNDGANSNGGGINVDLGRAYPELFIRFYMRYQSGFRWSSLNYTKELYLTPQGPGAAEIGFHGGTAGGSTGVVGTGPRFGPYVEQVGRYVDAGPGWGAVMGGPVSDGQWHAYEIHIKAGTALNGVSEQWIDCVQRLPAVTNVNWNTTNGWDGFMVGSNQATPANGAVMFTDYDDLVVATARVGCLP
jgi:hypothetical protein